MDVIARGTAVEPIGTYRVLRTLAKGETTDVLPATTSRPSGSERNVVLKVLREEYARNERFTRAFSREGKAYACVAHPAIVQLHQLLSFARQPVLVLEYVDGATLSRASG